MALEKAEEAAGLIYRGSFAAGARSTKAADRGQHEKGTEGAGSAPPDEGPPPQPEETRGSTGRNAPSTAKASGETPSKEPRAQRKGREKATEKGKTTHKTPGPKTPNWGTESVRRVVGRARPGSTVSVPARPGHGAGCPGVHHTATTRGEAHRCRWASPTQPPPTGAAGGVHAQVWGGGTFLTNLIVLLVTLKTT